METPAFSEIISAAVDGERVDVGALRRVLGAPEGRDALAAFVVIRAAAAADKIEPSEGVVRAVERAVQRGASGNGLQAGPPARRHWYLAGPRVPATLAAAVALVAVAASLWGALTFRLPPTTVVVRVPAPAAAPTPVIVPPAPAASSSVERTASARRLEAGRRAAPRPVVAQPLTPAQPPTPTRVLRFVPGVDWVSGAE